MSDLILGAIRLQSHTEAGGCCRTPALWIERSCRMFEVVSVEVAQVVALDEAAARQVEVEEVGVCFHLHAFNIGQELST